MRTIFFTKTTSVALLSFGATLSTSFATPEPSVEQVIEEAFRVPAAVNFEADLTMEVLKSDGRLRSPRRKLSLYLKSEPKSLKLLAVMREPQDLANTKALLLRENDQAKIFVQLPGAKKPAQFNFSKDDRGILSTEFGFLESYIGPKQGFRYRFNTGPAIKRAEIDCGEKAYSITAEPESPALSELVYSDFSISRARKVVCAVRVMRKNGDITKSIKNSDFKKVAGMWHPERILITLHAFGDLKIPFIQTGFYLKGLKPLRDGKNDTLFSPRTLGLEQP